MRYRLLGRTGMWKTIGGMDQAAATAMVKQAFVAGVNFIDTANVYASGESETMTGHAIKTLGLPRDEIVLATKAFGAMDDNAINGRGQSRYHLMHALDASLQRLQVDHIDLYQMHGYDPLTPLEEVLSTLNDMVRSGKVRSIGLCNMAAWQVMKALAWLLALPQLTTVIVGAKTAAQLADNLGASTLQLSADDMQAHNEVSALPPEYPGWMLERQGGMCAKAPVRE